MRVGILGSGLMGGKLGTLFARAGHDVVFSYARSQRKLERLAWEAGKNARAGADDSLIAVERPPGDPHPGLPDNRLGVRIGVMLA